MAHPVAIVGGGLAGLTAARLLHRAGIGFQILEARNRLGGRILSADSAGEMSCDGFDLGPSWCWPDMQPRLATLIRDLGLACFPQYDQGDVLLQPASREKPQRYPGMRQVPPSMRLAGGTGAIVASLASCLPEGSIRLGTRVTHVSLRGDEVELRLAEANEAVRAAHVVFALPPRLLEATVVFSPTLAAATVQRWRDTPTWMAPHAKFFAIYDRPFWRDAGLSGTAQSMVGPLVEIHDATTASGQAALFGFVGVPADHRAGFGRDTIIAASVRQLANLFGPQAGTPRATLLKDWAADPLTATEGDRQAGGHPVPTDHSWVGGEWRDRITLAGSETSRSEPGYLAGAIEAAERAVMEIVNRIKWTHEKENHQS